MRPSDHTRTLQNGGVQVSEYVSGKTRTYWVKAGVAVVEFPQEEWDALIEIIHELEADDGTTS